MARIVTIDADVIALALDEINELEPLFRAESEMLQFVGALEKLAREIGSPAVQETNESN